MAGPDLARITPEQLDRATGLVRTIGAVVESTVVGQRRLRETLLIGPLTGGHLRPADLRGPT